jgi:hypothetical protein
MGQFESGLLVSLKATLCRAILAKRNVLHARNNLWIGGGDRDAGRILRGYTVKRPQLSYAL